MNKINPMNNGINCIRNLPKTNKKYSFLRLFANIKVLTQNWHPLYHFNYCLLSIAFEDNIFMFSKHLSKFLRISPFWQKQYILKSMLLIKEIKFR